MCVCQVQRSKGHSQRDVPDMIRQTDTSAQRPCCKSHCYLDASTVVILLRFSGRAGLKWWRVDEKKQFWSGWSSMWMKICVTRRVNNAPTWCLFKKWYLCTGQHCSVEEKHEAALYGWSVFSAVSCWRPAGGSTALLITENVQMMGIQSAFNQLWNSQQLLLVNATCSLGDLTVLWCTASCEQPAPADVLNPPLSTRM